MFGNAEKQWAIACPLTEIELRFRYSERYERLFLAGKIAHWHYRRDCRDQFATEEQNSYGKYKTSMSLSGFNLWHEGNRARKKAHIVLLPKFYDFKGKKEEILNKALEKFHQQVNEIIEKHREMAPVIKSPFIIERAYPLSFSFCKLSRHSRNSNSTIGNFRRICHWLHVIQRTAPVNTNGSEIKTFDPVDTIPAKRERRFYLLHLLLDVFSWLQITGTVFRSFSTWTTFPSRNAIWGFNRSEVFLDVATEVMKLGMIRFWEI